MQSPGVIRNNNGQTAADNPLSKNGSRLVVGGWRQRLATANSLSIPSLTNHQRASSLEDVRLGRLGGISSSTSPGIYYLLLGGAGSEFSSLSSSLLFLPCTSFHLRDHTMTEHTSGLKLLPPLHEKMELEPSSCNDSQEAIEEELRSALDFHLLLLL